MTTATASPNAAEAHLSHRMEKFSDAYLKAIVATAGYAIAKPDIDNARIDWTISSRGVYGTSRAPKLDVQLKCVNKDAHLKAKHVAIQLNADHYDDLRAGDRSVPIILIAVVVPPTPAAWLSHRKQTSMLLHHCAYWRSLLGEPEVTTESVTVKIPRNQQLSVASLSEIFQKIGRREPL